MQDIYFSIIIPVHNREHTLDRCIKSILEQTYSKFELLLVDDHSTDGSINKIKEYCSIDSRVKLFQQKDDKHGAQAARNLGILNAKYEWIMFNDSDDTWVPEKIEKQLSVLKDNGFNERMILYSDCNTIKITTGEKKLWSLPHVPVDNSYNWLLIHPAPIFITLVCSKKLLSEINYLDENVPSYQEWDTSIRLSKNGIVEHLREPLANYYIGANDTISKDKTRDFIGKSYILNKYKNEIINIHGEKKFKELLALYYENAKKNHVINNLQERNKIISDYEENLIFYFGEKYTGKTYIYVKKLKIQRIIKKLIGAK